LYLRHKRVSHPMANSGDDGSQLRERTFARDSLEAQLKAAAKDVVTELEAEEARADVPYWKQGNIDMYSTENISKRIALKSHPGIVEAVEKWWSVVGEGDGAGESKREVSRRAYMRMSGAIFVALLGSDVDGPTLVENWDADRAGSASLDEKRFFEAIFELADVWCEGVEAQEYIDFLDRTLWDTYQVLQCLAPRPSSAALSTDKTAGAAETLAAAKKAAEEVASELAALGFGGLEEGAITEVELQGELADVGATEEEAAAVRSFMASLGGQGAVSGGSGLAASIGKAKAKTMKAKGKTIVAGGKPLSSTSVAGVVAKTSIAGAKTLSNTSGGGVGGVRVNPASAHIDSRDSKVIVGNVDSSELPSLGLGSGAEGEDADPDLADATEEEKAAIEALMSKMGGASMSTAMLQSKLGGNEDNQVSSAARSKSSSSASSDAMNISAASSTSVKSGVHVASASAKSASSGASSMSASAVSSDSTASASDTGAGVESETNQLLQRCAEQLSVAQGYDEFEQKVQDALNEFKDKKLIQAATVYRNYGDLTGEDEGVLADEEEEDDQVDELPPQGSKPNMAAQSDATGAGDDDSGQLYLEPWTGTNTDATGQPLAQAAEKSSDFLDAMAKAAQGGEVEKCGEKLIVPLVTEEDGICLGVLVVDRPKMEEESVKGLAKAISNALEPVLEEEEAAATQILQQLAKGNPRGKQALMRLQAGLGACPVPRRPLRQSNKNVPTRRLERTGSDDLWYKLNRRTFKYTAPDAPRKLHLARRQHLFRVYRAARFKLQRLMYRSKLKAWLAEIKRYASPPRTVVTVMASLFLILNDKAVCEQLGKKRTIPDDTKPLWITMRKAIDLSMVSPNYLVKRMKNMKRVAKENKGESAQEDRFTAAEKLVQDITYKGAKKSSRAAAIIWKWILLVSAEGKLSTEEDSEGKEN